MAERIAGTIKQHACHSRKGREDRELADRGREKDAAGYENCPLDYVIVIKPTNQNKSDLFQCDKTKKCVYKRKSWKNQGIAPHRR